MLAVENLKVYFDVKNNRGVKTKLRAVDGVSLHLKKVRPTELSGESGPVNPQSVKHTNLAQSI